MKIILASASERRQELLGRLVDDFKIEVSKFDEDISWTGSHEHGFPFWTISQLKSILLSTKLSMLYHPLIIIKYKYCVVF